MSWIMVRDLLLFIF